VAGPVTNKALLMAGIAAVGLYVIGDLVSGLLYGGYSYIDQAISELTAFGSPVRPLMVTVILTHGVLLLAFGVGVLRASTRKSVSWLGGLLIAIGIVGFPTHTVWAMSSRGMETGFNDTMHIILSALFSGLVIAAMALSAVAYRGWFRVYSLATIAVVVGFGMAASFAIQGIEQNDTPWAGGFERINAYAYFAWLIVLAVTVMRREVPATRARPGRTPTPTSDTRPTGGDLTHRLHHSRLRWPLDQDHCGGCRRVMVFMVPLGYPRPRSAGSP
jgi:hypothetical protein